MINSDFPRITINGKRLSTNCKITVGETQKNIIGITLNNKETFVRDPTGVTFYFTQDSGLEPIVSGNTDLNINYIPSIIGGNQNRQYLETIVFGCNFTTLRGGVLDSSVYTSLKQIIVNSVDTWLVYNVAAQDGPLFTINLTEWSWLGYCRGIGNGWCKMCYYMEKLQMPFTALEWIGTNGFQQNGAWSETSNLGKVTIDPNGSRCEIAVNAFEESKFNEVEIKQTLQPTIPPKLGNFSFANMRKLKTVKLLNTLIQPYLNGTNWFSNSTVYKLDWGEGVNLPNTTFNNCSYLKEVTFPSTVTSIESIFARCDNLLNVDLSKITSNVTSIAVGAFEGCKFIQMDIPSTIATIGINAFDSSYGSLYPYEGEDAWDYGDNPTQVLHWASHIRFKDRSYGQVSLMSGFPWASKNYNLNYFSIEYSDPTPGAVKDCTPRFVYDVKTPTYLDYNSGDPSINQNINTVIHNNAELKAAATYPNANLNLTLYDMFEPTPYSDNNTIRGAFENTYGANDTNIRSVTLKCPLTKCVYINGYAYNNFYRAFAGQQSLDSVTWDPYVLNGEVPDGMFENCIGLFTYTNTTLFRVGDGAFYNTTSLDSIDLSKTWWIGSRAFYNSNITINSTSTPINDISTQNGAGRELGIGTEAFKNCSNLTEVQIRGAVSIGTNAFENTNITTIRFLNCSGVTIGDYVFTDCYWLELIEFNCDSSTYFDLSTSMFQGSTDTTKVVMRFNGLNQSDIENLSNYPWNLSDPTTQIRGDDWVDPNS